MLPGLVKCSKGHLYPGKRFDECPTCNPDAKPIIRPLTADQIDAAVANSLSRGDIDKEQIR